MKNLVPRSVGIHDGGFHADEISACALLIITNRVDRSNIVRSRDPDLLAQCEYLCDVGGFYDPKEKRFDHHQSLYQGLLSSAGMVLLYLRDEGDFSQEDYEYLHDSIIKGIDDHDNGRMQDNDGEMSFSEVISHFNPPEYDALEEVREPAFIQALDFAVSHYQRMLVRQHYIRDCRKLVEDAMTVGDRYLTFSREIPWQESFFALGGKTHHALFIIMPSGSQWKLRGIPPSMRDRMNVRLPLPEEWAGLMNEELQQVSGISGAVFCHKGRFTSIWETKEAAEAALQLVLEVS